MVRQVTEWRVVPSWPDYEASDDCRIRRIANGRVMQKTSEFGIGQYLNKQGYPKVRVGPGNNNKHRFVHVLVAEAFIGPRPEGLQVDHINGDKLDCRPSNLRYITRLENIRAGIPRHNHQPSRDKTATLTPDQVYEIRAKFDGGGFFHRELGEQYGMSAEMIGRIVRRQSWKHLPEEKAS